MTAAELDSRAHVLAPVVSLEGAKGVMILDAADGRELWWAANDAPNQWLDARLSPNGSSVFLMSNDAVFREGGQSTLVALDADGATLRATTLKNGHHSLDVLDGDDGETRLAWLQAHIQADLGTDTPVVDDRLMTQRLDEAPTVLLDVLDVLPYDAALRKPDDTRFYDGKIDWSHANGLRWSAERERFTVSLAELDAVWEVTASGDITAVFTSLVDAPRYYQRGAAWSERTFPIFETAFSNQHGAEIDESGDLRLLANMDDADEPSFAAVYRVQDDIALVEHRFYSPFTTEHAIGLGGACALPGGGTLVSWGAM